MRAQNKTKVRNQNTTVLPLGVNGLGCHKGSLHLVYFGSNFSLNFNLHFIVFFFFLKEERTHYVEAWWVARQAHS